MPITVPQARKRVLAIAKETTYGTDAINGQIQAAQIIPVFNLVVDKQIEEIENLSLAGKIGRLPSVIGRKSATISFSMWIRGLTTAFDDAPSLVVPAYHLPLMGAGFSPAFSVANGSAWDKITYTRVDKGESMTLYLSQQVGADGVAGNANVIKLTGCYGNLTLSAQAGSPMVATFRFFGSIAGQADQNFVEATVPDTPIYPSSVGVNFQIGTENYGPCFANYGLEMNSQLARVDCMNAASGIMGYVQSDVRPVHTIDPMWELAAVYDWYAKHIAANTMDLSLQIGNTQFNRFKIISNKVQIVRQGDAVRDGIAVMPTNLLATLDSTDVTFEAT